MARDPGGRAGHQPGRAGHQPGRAGHQPGRAGHQPGRPDQVPAEAVEVRRGGLLVVAAAALWGTTGTAQALGPDLTTPAGVGAIRLLVGAAGLLVLAVGRGDARTTFPRQGGMTPLGGAALLGGVAVAAYQLSFFAAVTRLGVALGTVVGIGSAPVFTGLLSAVLLRQAPSRRWLGATLLATVGVGVLLAPRADVTVDAAGMLLALLAGATYAGYAVAGKALIDGGLNATTSMAVLFCIGALLTMPVLAVERMGWLLSVPGLALAAWLGLATTTLSYVLFGRGLTQVGAPTAATLSLAEPLTAAILGVVLLSERPGPVQALGAALVLAGLLLTLRRGGTPHSP